MTTEKDLIFMRQYKDAEHILSLVISAAAISYFEYSEQLGFWSALLCLSLGWLTTTALTYAAATAVILMNERKAKR